MIVHIVTVLDENFNPKVQRIFPTKEFALSYATILTKVLEDYLNAKSEDVLEQVKKEMPEEAKNTELIYVRTIAEKFAVAVMETET